MLFSFDPEVNWALVAQMSSTAWQHHQASENFLNCCVEYHWWETDKKRHLPFFCFKIFRFLTQSLLLHVFLSFFFCLLKSTCVSCFLKTAVCCIWGFCTLNWKGKQNVPNFQHLSFCTLTSFLHFYFETHLSPSSKL